MTIDWIYIIVCLISAGMTLMATPVIKQVALKLKQLDDPSERKIHHQPMVRLGGIAIFSAPVFSLFICRESNFLGQFPTEDLLTVGLLLLGGSGFFLIGFVDDLFDLSPFNRLWMQAAVASGLWFLGIRLDTVVIPGLAPIHLIGYLSLPITVLWLVGVVNAINWMDGLDGLAAGVASIALIVLVVIGVTLAQPVTILLGMALLGSLLGFLYYNYNPATIFMGDGGSYFIGFILASLCIVGPQKLESPFATVLPLVILAVPLGDMVWVIVSRLYQGKSPFFADNRHLHHRLLQRNLSHKATVWIVYLLAAVTGSFACVLAGVPHALALWAGLLAALAFLMWQIRQVLAMPGQVSNIVMREGIWFSENL